MSVDLLPQPIPQPNKADIRFIPREELKTPVWNPRPFFDEIELQELMEYIKNGRPTPRILVWKGEGKAPWWIIDGQRRLEARNRLGQSLIEVEILDIPLEDAMFLAIAANRDNKPFWLGEYVAVERLLKMIPDPKQATAKAKLGWTKKRVSYADSLTQLLNPTARELIYQTKRQEVPRGNSKKTETDQEPSGKGKWWFTERVGIALIPILGMLDNANSQALVELVVRKIIEHKLDSVKTKELVVKALNGKDLDQFVPFKSVKKPRTSKKGGKPHQDPPSQPPENGNGSGGGDGASTPSSETGTGGNGSGQPVQETVTPPVNGSETKRQALSHMQKLVLYLVGLGQLADSPKVSPKPATQKTTPSMTATPEEPEKKDGSKDLGLLAGLKEIGIGFAGAALKDFFGKLSKNPWQAIGQLLWEGFKAFCKVIGHAIKWSVKKAWKLLVSSIRKTWQVLTDLFGPVVKWFLRAALAIAILVAIVWAVWTYGFHPSNLISRIKSLGNGMVSHFMGEKKNSTPAVVPTPLAVPPQQNPAPTPPPAKPKHASKPKVLAKKGSSSTQNSSASVASSPSSSFAPTQNPLDADSSFVLGFAQALYSIGYLNYQDREATLLGWVTQDYAGDLKGHYFNPYVLKNMESIHRTKAFTPDGPAKWVFSNETTEEFSVSGTIIGQGEWNGQPSNSTKHVKARFDIIHDTGGKILVKKINEEISE